MRRAHPRALCRDAPALRGGGGTGRTRKAPFAKSPRTARAAECPARGARTFGRGRIPARKGRVRRGCRPRAHRAPALPRRRHVRPRLGPARPPARPAVYGPRDGLSLFIFTFAAAFLDHHGGRQCPVGPIKPRLYGAAGRACAGALRARRAGGALVVSLGRRLPRDDVGDFRHAAADGHFLPLVFAFGGIRLPAARRV